MVVNSDILPIKNQMSQFTTVPQATLRQKTNRIFPKSVNFKIKDNLTFEQKAAHKVFSQSTDNKVYSYGKSNGFVIVNNKMS